MLHRDEISRQKDALVQQADHDKILLVSLQVFKPELGRCAFCSICICKECGVFTSLHNKCRHTKSATEQAVDIDIDIDIEIDIA